MNDIELIKKITACPKSIFSLSDLEKILDAAPSGLRTVVSRLTKKGVLNNVGCGWYSVFGKPVLPEEAAGQIYYPSYLSLKTVLSRVGWINQIPREAQFVTPRKTWHTQIAGVSIVFRQIAPKLFFGYELTNGMQIAYPEKALLDLLYYVSRGRDNISFSELALRDLNIKRWHDFKKSYPKEMEELIDAVQRRL